MQVKNKNNEDLFIIVITNSKEFNDPIVLLKTWPEAKEMFEKKVTERDDDSYKIKQLSITRDEKRKLQAQLLCNHKGWGKDYFEFIKIEKAYAF